MRAMMREATLTETRGTGTRSRRALRVALGALALLLGLGCLALGGAVFASAHDTHPVEIDGTVADYHEITINGAYARNELRLTSDPHTYIFDSRQFHPALPQRFQKDARIQIWVDEGTTNVLAVTLYDEMGINPTGYTTNAYDNPTLAFATTEGEAGALAVMGVALLIAGALSLLIRRKPRRAVRPDGTSATPQPAPVALGPARPPSTPWQASLAPQPYPIPATPAALGANPAAALGAQGAGMPAIPLSQAAPTTPAPNRPPRGATSADVDQLPTQKSPAVPPAGTPSGFVAPPGVQPLPPSPAQPDNTVEAAASPFAAWGIAPQPQENGTPSHLVRPPSLQPLAPPANSPANPQASAPPGSLPDFPTERMPTPSGAPPGDLSDEPTRKSETVAPPDIGGQ